MVKCVVCVCYTQSSWELNCRYEWKSAFFLLLFTLSLFFPKNTRYKQLNWIFWHWPMKFFFFRISIKTVNRKKKSKANARMKLVDVLIEYLCLYVLVRWFFWPLLVIRSRQTQTELNDLSHINAYAQRTFLVGRFSFIFMPFAIV